MMKQTLKKMSALVAAGDDLSQEDREFLSLALINIADGGDAEIALNVKAKRGERKSAAVRDNKITRQFVNGWIATAIAAESEGGLGMTLKDAVKLLKSDLGGLPSEAALRRYFDDVKDTQKRDFYIETD